MGMARTFSAEEARQAIKEHGFFAIQDQEIGLRISEMEKKKSSFSLKTIEGFHFCKVNVLMEKRIQGTLGSFMRQHILADYTRLAPSRGTIYQLRRGGSDDVLRTSLGNRLSSNILPRIARCRTLE